MPRHVIREVRVDPPVPPELVVFRREDIERFIETAFRTVAKLENELEIARMMQAPAAMKMPPWTDRAPENPAGWFESLRDVDDRTLIAGA